jgi:hypothetical protein
MKKEEKRNKRNAVLLLVSLFVYAFLLVFVFRESAETFKYSDSENKSNLVGLAGNLEYREIEELEKVEIVQTRSEVLGEDDSYLDSSVKDFMNYLRDYFVGSCDEPQYEIFEPQLFCGGSGGIEGQEIKIAQIWAPDILFVGAAAPYDNLVQTSNPDGRTAFRNSSEIINPDFDYYINMPPDSGSLLESSPLSDEEKFEIYEMHYEAAGELNEIPFDVHPEEESRCPNVVNAGEFNVKGSNNLQKELTDSITPPGIMELGNRDVSADLCRDDRVIELDEDESFLLCNEGFFQALSCTVENVLKFEDKCDDIGDLVIDAPLGSGEVCNEDDCSVRYSEAARLVTSPPTETEELYPESLDGEQKENDYIVDDPVIITTPCYVRVDCQICETRCIWDISMWQHIFKLEKTYTYPGYENEMDEDLYWQAVEDEIRWRGRYGGSRY